MINMDECFKNAAKLNVSYQGKDSTGLRNSDGSGEVTTVHGYDKDGKLMFYAIYDKNGNFRLSVYEGDHGTRMNENIYSDDVDDITLSDYQKKRIAKAAKFIDSLKKNPQVKQAAKPKSYREVLKEGANLKLSKESRLSFAPDIENLQVKLDDKGRITMEGTSKDGKQSVCFVHDKGSIEMIIKTEKTSRSYNNKMGGKFTWRNLKSPSGTRYFDDKGENYAKEMARVMDKFKQAHQNKSQQHSQMIVKGGRES